MNIKRTDLVLRAGLLVLGGEAGIIGVQALFFPHYFYTQFFLGRGWVQMLPPYNEHITRDLGALYIGFFAVLAYAAAKLSRDLVNGAILGFVVATVPHMVFHIVHAEDAPKLTDKVLQIGLLAITSIMGVGLMRLGRGFFDGQETAANAAAPGRVGALR